MSELKDYSILDIEAIDDERFKKEKWVPESRVYLKSDVDKEIAYLQNQLELARTSLIKSLAQAQHEAHHNKYKRCLAMAMWCMARDNEWAAYYPTTTTRKMKFLDKWEKRWREIAEKFKVD